MSRRSPPRRSAFPTALALASLVTVAACNDQGADRRSTADADLARDLALVQSAGSPQPIFRDTALTTASVRRDELPTPVAPPLRAAPRQARHRQTALEPRAARPAARRETPPSRPTRVSQPTPPEPETADGEAERAGESGAGRIGAGAVLMASSNARVCTRTNLPGDRITATVNEPVRGADGAEIPAGAKVVLEVTSIDTVDPPASGQVVFRVTSVAIGDDSYPASGRAIAAGTLEPAQTARNASSDRKKVIGGAIAGAVLGQIMGKDTRSTVIGAAAGAAAGTAAARMGDRGEACLPAGAPTRIVLESYQLSAISRWLQPFAGR